MRLKPRTIFLNFGLSFCPLIFAFLECQIPLTPPFLKGDLEGFLNVVAQFIGRLCLMNQATTKSRGFFCYQRGIKKGFIIAKRVERKVQIFVAKGN
jgi:hypothetical protein